MNSLTRIMSYDNTKNKNQECNCDECVSVENVENQILEYPKLSEEEIEQIINERYSDKDEKTKTFIRKALRKHGDRYDYSKTIYIKAREVVEIICRIKNHKSFLQTPDAHLSGRGCKYCGRIKSTNKQRLTIEEFIEKANEIHGIGTYDYSKVNYVNNYTEVIIICPKHGEFFQIPNNHLRGHGCYNCRNEKISEYKVSTKEEFIEKANEIHGIGIYDYSKVIYVNNHTEVIIICPKHGEFLQTPNNHLSGKGCFICGVEHCHEKQKLTLKEFIKRANQIHGIGTYDYSKVNYVDIHTEVIIICPKHGEFTQLPSVHLTGCGCSKCTNNYKGEIAVRNWLIENEIEFEEQKRFNDCRNIKPLSFDFYIPQYNLCIEFDGKGHFEKINWDGKMTDEEMENNLQEYKRRDAIKNEYCKKKGIVLLRLNDINTIENELTQYFIK